MKKRILFGILSGVIIIAMIILVIVLISKSNKSTNVLSQNEMKELSEEAGDYFETARYSQAIATYQKLIDGGCTDGNYFGGYPERSAEDAFEILKQKATLYSIMCINVSNIVSKIKRDLNDPNSLTIYNIKIKAGDTYDVFYLTLDYGAKNKLGGMVRTSYTGKCYIGKNDQERIYNLCKKDYTNANTLEEVVKKYSSDTSFLPRSSAYETIIKNEQSYYFTK